MQLWERQAILGGATIANLMQEAVEGCLKVIQSQIHAPRQTIIFCGRGNNGNDGLTLAYELQKLGWPVQVILTHQPKERTAPPFPHLDDLIKQALVWPITPQRNHKPKLVIDALLGIGARGPAHGATKEIIAWCRNRKNPTDIYLSIDIPSGLDPDASDGEALILSKVETFPADITCAIGAVKQGCLRDAARPSVGKIFGIPLPISETPTLRPEGEFFTVENAVSIFQRIPNVAHKHARGRVSIWAGSMPGAAILASRAALRAGAGLVKLYAKPEVIATTIAQVPEVIAHPVNPDEHLPASFFDCHAHVIGPGLGRHPITRESFFEMLPCLVHPVVLDADALYFLSTDLEQIRRIGAPFIFTPHVKEMQRLVDKEFSERDEIASAWVKEHGGTLLLKGPHTIIAEKDKNLSFNSTGNPGLATAGTGDILAGILGGLLAQEYSCWDAARMGAFLHGLAADLAVADSAEQSLIASDVANYLGKAWRQVIDFA